MAGLAAAFNGLRTIKDRRSILDGVARGSGATRATAFVATRQISPQGQRPSVRSRRRQHPILERRPIAQSAGLAHQHRHVMPGVVNRLATAEAAPMLGHDPPVLRSDRRRHECRLGSRRRWRSRVPVVVEADEACLRHQGRQRMEAVEAAAIRDQLRPFAPRSPHYRWIMR
jgi:hypothetical protein